jgi:hypothetical protein
MSKKLRNQGLTLIKLDSDCNLWIVDHKERGKIGMVAGSFGSPWTALTISGKIIGAGKTRNDAIDLIVGYREEK